MSRIYPNKVSPVGGIEWTRKSGNGLELTQWH